MKEIQKAPAFSKEAIGLGLLPYLSTMPITFVLIRSTMSGDSHHVALDAGIEVLKQFPGNKRGRPNLGTLSRTGLSMYPVADSKNIDETRYLREPQQFKSKDPLGQPADMRAFRNISQSLFHSPNPVSDRSSAMLSIERKFDKGPPSVVAVSNAVPIQDPRIAVDEGQQRQAFHGQLKRDAEGNPITEGTHAERFRKPFSGVRSRHLWTQGNLDQQLMLDLMQNKLNLADLGLNVGRTYHGDIALFDDKGFEMPRLGYSVFDTNREGQRQYREDTGMPWREARDYQVTGSVDPLLMIPSPDYQSGYVEHEGRAGVPVPPTMAMGGQKGLNQGLATARYGLYFNPDDLTPEGMKVYERALSGDIIRSEEAAAIFEDAWSIVKYDRPEPLAPLASIMGVKNMESKSKPYRRQLQSAFIPLLEEGRTLVEPFMGGGGITYGLQPESHIGSDIDPSMVSLHRAIQARPEIFDSKALQDMILSRVGDTPEYAKYTGPGGKIENRPVGGPITQEEMDQFGMEDLGGIYYGIEYFKQQAKFNHYKDKMDSVGLTPEEEIDYLRTTWFLAQNAYSRSFRYGDGGYMNMPGPNPKAAKRYGYKSNVPDIYASGKVNRERFGLDEDFMFPFIEGRKDVGRGTKGPHGPRKEGHGSVPDWMHGANPLKQPAYFAAATMPRGVTEKDTQLGDYHRALRGSNILNLGVEDLIRNKKIPDNAVFALDPPYRGQEGQHQHWKGHHSDLIGRVFQALARQGRPVTWHDSAHPANLAFVDDSVGDYAIAMRHEMNRKAAEDKKKQPEMFAFANMPWLDPEEVSTWTDSKGAWTP